MSLWVDKHRPTSFSALTFHNEANKTLQNLAVSTDLPHLLFYGPPGSGKMTRIRVLLQQVFDMSISKIKYEEKVFVTPSGRKVDIVLFSSNYHVELTPSDAGIYDRVVVQEIIKELAQTQQIDKTKKNFKVVVINDAEKLSKDAQHALRRTMEKYSANIRFIFCCSSIGRVISPIKSRCLLFRFPSPTDEQISGIVGQVCASEGFKVTPSVVQEVLKAANGNVRKAVLAAEASSISSQALQKDWSFQVKNIASMIMKEQSPACLLSIRAQFYGLLNHCIPASLILKALFFALLDSCNPSLSQEMCAIFGEYDHRLSKGSKAVFHLEAAVAKAMCCLAKFK